jgi:hypothetical protein
MGMVQLDNEVIEMLRRLDANAAARHVSLAAYLKRLAEYDDEFGDTDNSLEAFKRDLAALSAGLEHLPPLPPGFSREDIYADHD